MYLSEAELAELHRPQNRERTKPQMVDVPFALLHTADLTPATKFLWIRLRFDEMHDRPRSHRISRLTKCTNLGRSTIYEALEQAEIAGWLVSAHEGLRGERRWRTACPARHDGTCAEIPAALIRASHVVRPQEVICFGMLQALPTFKRGKGEFKWAELRRATGLDDRTVKRAIRRLAELHWIYMVQKTRVTPIRFQLQDADQAFKDELVKFIQEGTYFGESVMRAFLSLIIDSKIHEDNASPGFLVNPRSGKRLELDRYYPVSRTAFEFNGPQHYVASEKHPEEEVIAQKKRDWMKHRICKDVGIKLVVVHAEDLSLKIMLRKIGDRAPRRVLRGYRHTIKYLNASGRDCMEAIARLTRR